MLIPLLTAIWLFAAPPADPAHFAPNAKANPVALPGGPLTFVPGGRSSAHFIVGDWTIRSGDIVDYWRYTVYRSEIPIGQGLMMAHGLDHERIDCAKRTSELVISRAYSADGRMLSWLPSEPPEPIRAGTIYAALAGVFCDGVRLPPANTVIGAPAAWESVRAGKFPA